MKIFDANISGSLNVSGAAHFFGDLTVDGTINATISGTTSNALNSDKLGGKEASTYATTGSNTFKDNQTITGSLFVSGNVVINGTSYTAATSGTSGSNGTNGSSGSNGTNGSSGTSGSNGTNGSSGTSGSNGTNGSSGSSGSNGTNGSSGSNGTDGSSGTSVSVSGTQNTIVKFGSPTGITNSNITDNGSLVTIGSSTTITGSLIVTQNLNVLGSASITYTTASQLRVENNIISVNSSSPAVRFAGLQIYDSGSSAATASLYWDSLNNKFLYQHPSGADTYASAWLMSGPVNSGALGSEVGLTTNRMVKAVDDDHIGDSNTADDGTTIRHLTNTEVTGSLKVTTAVTAAGFTGSGASLTSIPNGGLVNSTITIGSTSTSLGGTSTTIAGLTSLTSTALTGSLQGSISGNAATVTTNANLTGDVTSTGNATTIGALKVTDAMLFGSISNAKLTNSSVTVTAGTGMSGGGSVALGSSVTLTNAGVTGVTAGTGIAVSSATGNPTISIGQAVATTSTVTFGALTVNGAVTLNAGTTTVTGALIVGGATTSTTVGLIRASNDVIAYASSDERLKENVLTITGSLDILKQINGYYFDWKELPGIHENEGHDIGVIAQEIEKVLPEIVTTRDNGYKAVKYEKLVALLIQTNKELLERVEALEAKIK